MDIQASLFALQEDSYKEFMSSLIPTISKDSIIGVRTSFLHKVAKEIYKSEDCLTFLQALPHLYFEENQIHSFIICQLKDFDCCLVHIERFLPFIDNWAVCDSCRPKALYKKPEKLYRYCEKWMDSNEEFTVRFGIEIAMLVFLKKDFCISFMEKIAKMQSPFVYVNKMRAWYFAEAISCHAEESIPFIKEDIIDSETKHLLIRKCIESRKISSSTKSYLKTLL